MIGNINYTFIKSNDFGTYPASAKSTVVNTILRLTKICYNFW